ncbi:MAG: hypothetical protein J6R18_05755 [Kiritimatiellae bacterium]|nr:hypothetical protein [Kiritimatiellia bacterium]
MKVLDIERKGNVVRFYLGADDLEKWWGDDWNDSPYELNAGTVYEQFVLTDADAVFPFDVELIDAHRVLRAGETVWCHDKPKNYYAETGEPFLYADLKNEWLMQVASKETLPESVRPFWLGMPWEECHAAIKAAGGFLLDGKAYKPEEDKQ